MRIAPKCIVQVVCIVIFITLLLLVGNVMFIANQIQMATNKYFAYTFYIVVFALLIIYIIIPIIKLLKRPSLKEFTFKSTDSVKNIANKLKEHYPDIPEGDTEKKEKRNAFCKCIKESVIDGEIVDINKLKEAVKNEIENRKNAIDEKIILYGKRVFAITAISQSNRFDTISVWYLNFRMISDLIETTGFKPTKIQLLHIYWRVIATGAFAYVASEVTNGTDENFLSNIGEAIGEKIGSSIFGKILGIFTKSLADGAVNGLLTLRLGYVTKKYLEEGFDKFYDSELNGEKVKNKRIDYYKESYRQAWKHKKELFKIA